MMDKFGSSPLFHLDDETPIYYGDILYHPDRRRVGWYCIAEFAANSDSDQVVVRAAAGAVPIDSGIIRCEGYELEEKVNPLILLPSYTKQE